ncbi:MAG: methyltransferase [Cyanobacteria bacterium]|nr:methyltransferase [Cyanobacteriota bacterium]
MERICEPELMDDPEQARVYAEADFAVSDAALVERIVALAAPEGLGSKLVDLGCGPGNISFRLAERFPAAELVGLDGSYAMLALAEQRRQAAAERWPRLSFRCLSLPLTSGDLGGLAGRCTAIVSNSLLHHLHNPAVLWQTLRLLAAPGALVHIHDLRRPQHPAALDVLIQSYASGCDPLLRRDYAASLRAAFRIEEVQTQLAQAGLGGLGVEAREDRYLEVRGRLA